MIKWLVLLSLVPTLAFGQIGSLFGINPQTAGMGSVSLFQGRPAPQHVFSAPAALGYIKNVEVGLSALYFDPHLKPFGLLTLNAQGTKGVVPTGVLPGGGQILSGAFPIGRERPLTLAGAVFLPFSTLIRVSGSPVNYPFYPLYTDISRNFFFIVGAGYEVIDGLALGVNVRSTTKSSTIYKLESSASVNYSATATEAKGESRLSYSVVYDNEKRDPARPFSVGVMYRAPAGLETKIAADVMAFVPVQGKLTSQPAYSPAEWVLMASLRAWERFTFSFDGAWAKWSPYLSPYGEGNINTYVIGGAKPAGFRDIPVLRFGADHGSPQNGKWLRKLSFRGGYLYHPTPVPDQTEDSNFVDNNRHMFTVGVGLGFRNPWRETDLIQLDLFTQYNWLVRREIHKKSTAFVGAPGYVTGGRIMLYGAGVTMKF